MLIAQIEHLLNHILSTLTLEKCSNHLIYGKVQVELFRTFELTIDFYVYKHCGLCMFITLLKSTIQMEIKL